MRDYSRINEYLNRLQSDIYEQSPDDGHTEWATDAIRKMVPVDVRGKKVLDIGCASQFCRKPFVNWFAMNYTGQDYLMDGSDFSFLPYGDGEFDLIFARHVLEHSPMPLLTLMEWHRVCKQYALIILPAPEYWQTFGRNHYYVLSKENWWNLFDVAGWKIVKEQDFITSDKLFMKHFMPEVKPRNKIWQGHPKIVEFRYLLEKK